MQATTAVYKRAGGAALLRAGYDHNKTPDAARQWGEPGTANTVLYQGSASQLSCPNWPSDATTCIDMWLRGVWWRTLIVL